MNSDSLDRYITGNYGEDQFRHSRRESKGPKWSYQWLMNATDEELEKALAQARNNEVYLGDQRRNGPKAFMWARRAADIEDQIRSRQN